MLSFRGSYVSFPPNYTESMFSSLIEDHENMIFAGSGYGRDFYGTTQGAYMSGVKQAHHVASMLSLDDSTQNVFLTIISKLKHFMYGEIATKILMSLQIKPHHKVVFLIGIRTLKHLCLVRSRRRSY